MKNQKKLTREEMKKVLGGNIEPPTCGGDCKSDSDCPSKCQCLGAKKGCQPVM